MEAPAAEAGVEPNTAPRFDATFRDRFGELVAWRRDVRRFGPGGVPEGVLTALFELAALAPSVGNCQPTRFVRVDDASRREAVAVNFEAANREALAAYRGERARLYSELKLAGLREAPVHLAVFCDEATEQGHGLGARTMPETRRYSAVCALHTFWLAARAYGLASAGCRSWIPVRWRKYSKCQATGRLSPISASAGPRRNTGSRNWSASAGRPEQSTR